MHVHVITFGCKVNQFESASIISSFYEHDIKYTKDITNADIIVINSCTVTNKAGAQSRNGIRKAIKANSHAILVITGCHSQHERNLQDSITELGQRKHLIVGSDLKDDIIKKVLSFSQSHSHFTKDIRNTTRIASSPVNHFQGRTRAYLKVQDGCDNFCSYCIVPHTRGNSRSIPIKAVLDQASTYISNGHKELVITGIHVGNYGKDLNEGYNITLLIEKLCSLFPDTHFRLSSIEPNEVDVELLKIMNENENFMSHLHIPLQSGCNKILKKMGRNYSTETFSRMIELCHAHVNDICIGLDTLVGFPGEDDSCFSSAKDFISKLDFTYLHVFPYSKRPGTEAAAYPNQVNGEAKTHRVAVLRELSRKKSSFFYEKFIGTIRPVLIETTKDKEGKLKGFTDNYIPVLMKGSDDSLNTIQHVMLSEKRENQVFGEIVS